MLTVRSRSHIYMAERSAALSLLSQWTCCICFVTFCTWISLQPPHRLYHMKGNSTQNSTVYRAYGNTVNFSHTSRLSISMSMYPYVTIIKYCTKMPINARNHARNSPFPLRHVDFHLTHECLGPPHSPCQTTARSLYALPHNDATKSPLFTMGPVSYTHLTLPTNREV